ncbi:MAG: helix-turn-helix domain-containing protein [Candidatus Margulisbacteria bacterium]|jgi:DNA-binding XRE family transcriptional regulator|nr:helix-turn-helix domain-containing protein [Candidatus Margulisiibacteriota bacterium]
MRRFIIKKARKKTKKSHPDRNWSKLYSTVVCPEFAQLGNKLEGIRTAKNLTKEDFANELNIGIFHYYRISRGTAKLSLLTVLKIAKILGFKANELLDF